MAKPSPKALAELLLGILAADRPRLLRLDDYLHGRHDPPYMPDMADAEYKLLAKRSVSNWMPLLVGTPSQALYVDGFRRGGALRPRPEHHAVPDLEVSGTPIDAKRTPEWDHWERSRLSSRQLAVHRGALAYGHSFTLTLKEPKGVTTKGLSALRTSAVFEDAANDDTPYAALTVTAWAKVEPETRATARMWDGSHEYAVSFKTLEDLTTVRVVRVRAHGASECPVTRFAASVDLEGRTIGVIGPMIPLQNRINQTVFDLLVVQSGGSFKVRWASGMAPPIERDPQTGEPILDEHGNPKPIRMNYNAAKMLFAEDHEVKFGTLDETPLGGYIESIDMSIRHLAAVSQTPPHHLLGQIANISAEALQAAETSLLRMIEEFRKSFGESWERVFRLAAELSEDDTSADDFHGEVLWRDMESKSMAQAADALGKLQVSLGIPARGLWARVPGVTQPEMEEWERLVEEQDAAGTMAAAIKRATPDRLPSRAAPPADQR